MATRDDWMRRLGPLYGGAVALVHSTSWPWPGEVHGDARAPGWVIVLGLPIGLAAWLVAALARGLHLPGAVAALLGLATLTFASAAIVERGVARRIDELDRAERTPGVAAVVTLVFVVLVRAAAVLAIAPAHWLGAFVGAAVLGRWGAVLVQALGEPLTGERAPRSLVCARVSPWHTAVLAAFVAIVAAFAMGQAGLAAFAIGSALAFALGLDAERRDRGLSAPVVATAAAVAELVALLAACA